MRSFLSTSSGVILFLSWVLTVSAGYPTGIEPPSGIAPLRVISEPTLHSIIENGVRPLVTAREQELYLQELDGSPPNWDQLHDEEGEEMGGRLFVFNRERDEVREGHALLTQRIAFVWSGFLRTYQPQHNGFSVAMGPELTPTEWGIVRFKPIGLPDEMVAVPSPDILPSLQAKLSAGETVEVGILFTGRLVPYESIMYGISHDGSEQGMVLPFVQIEGVEYFLQLGD